MSCGARLICAQRWRAGRGRGRMAQNGRDLSRVQAHAAGERARAGKACPRRVSAPTSGKRTRGRSTRPQPGKGKRAAPRELVRGGGRTCPRQGSVSATGERARVVEARSRRENAPEPGEAPATEARARTVEARSAERMRLRRKHAPEPRKRVAPRECVCEWRTRPHRGSARGGGTRPSRGGASVP